MASRIDLELDECNISKYKYRQLKYFCLRYEEMKKELQDLYNLDFHTKKIKTVMSKIEQDLELIEQTAINTDASLYPYILQNVTKETCAYEYLCVPCGKRQFYGYRRVFFYKLAERMGMV